MKAFEFMIIDDTVTKDKEYRWTLKAWVDGHRAIACISGHTNTHSEARDMIAKWIEILSSVS